MKPIQVQVSIKIDSISDTFNPSVKSMIEGITSYDFELPFFLPKVYRPKQENLSQIERDNILNLRKNLSKTISAWLDYQFPALMKPGTATKITDHVVSYIQYCCPQFSMDSEEFENLVKATVIPLTVDFFADNKELFAEGYDKAELQSGLEIVKEALEATDGLTKFDEDIKQRLFGFEKLHSNRFASMVAGVVYDYGVEQFPVVGDTNLKKHQNFIKNFIRAGQAECSFQANELSGTSINTLRYFRSLAGSISHLISAVVILKEKDIRPVISSNPVFIRFCVVVDEISASFNDILGLQKDIRNGEDNGVVFFKLKAGTPLKAALNEEIQLLKDNIQDYAQLRELLLKKFSDEENMQEYLEITDSVLYGLFQVFADSEMYGMKNQIICR